MPDIFEPLFFDECLIVGVLRAARGWERLTVLGVIDPERDVHGHVWNIYDLNRCSYGSRQRVRVIETR